MYETKKKKKCHVTVPWIKNLINQNVLSWAFWLIKNITCYFKLSFNKLKNLNGLDINIGLRNNVLSSSTRKITFYVWLMEIVPAQPFLGKQKKTQKHWQSSWPRLNIYVFVFLHLVLAHKMSISRANDFMCLHPQPTNRSHLTGYSLY